MPPRRHEMGCCRLPGEPSCGRAGELTETGVFDGDRYWDVVRSLSRYHAEHPYMLEVDGARYRVDYEPSESRTPLFGGNSNWRGPIWFPINYLLVEALRRYDGHYGGQLTVELPTGSGRSVSLGAAADELARRLTALFLPDGAGGRPMWGGREPFASDPRWGQDPWFFEYFDGETGAGFGASHQTTARRMISPLR